MLGEAATNFARCAGRPEPDLSDAAGWLSQSDMHRLPLFAGAAAMHAVLEPNQAFGIDAPELLRDLAKRERRRVRKASEACGLGKVGLERLLALGVLGDGLSESAVRELGKSGVCDGPAQDPVAALVDTPWWHNGRLLRLQPDRPAAAFLDAALFNEQFPTGPTNCRIGSSSPPKRMQARLPTGSAAFSSIWTFSIGPTGPASPRRSSDRHAPSRT